MRTRINPHGIALDEPFAFEVDAAELARREALAAARQPGGVARPPEHVLSMTRSRRDPDHIEQQRWAAWDRANRRTHATR